ncbi:MAG: FmdE family protein [Nitrospirota bacterium]
MRIGKFSFDEFCEVVREFHGSPAPGVLIGGYMVDMACGELPKGVLFEALCETGPCLPDAVQLLTPCTLGNGRIHVMHVGRYALTLYDKVTGEGARVFVDAQRLAAWPETQAWFLKLKPKAQQDSARLMAEIQDVGTALLGVRRVVVDISRIRREKVGPVRLCPECGEAYPSSDGELCGGCIGRLPYVKEIGFGTVR